MLCLTLAQSLNSLSIISAIGLIHALNHGCYIILIVTILYLISSKQQLPVTIEAMKLMVKALVTPNVKAIVTAMFIAAVREGIEGLHLC